MNRPPWESQLLTNTGYPVLNITVGRHTTHLIPPRCEFIAFIGSSITSESRYVQLRNRLMERTSSISIPISTGAKSMDSPHEGMAYSNHHDGDWHDAPRGLLFRHRPGRTFPRLFCL